MTTKKEPEEIHSTRRDMITLAIIATVPMVLPSILSFMLILLTRDNAASNIKTQAAIIETQAAVLKTSNAIEELEHNTNSIKDELVKVTEVAAFARGVKSAEESPEGKGTPTDPGPDKKPDLKKGL